MRAAPRFSELTPEEQERLFEQFAVTHEKSYKDADEKAMRFEIFKRNLKRIDEVGRKVATRCSLCISIQKLALAHSRV